MTATVCCIGKKKLSSSLAFSGESDPWIIFTSVPSAKQSIMVDQIDTENRYKNYGKTIRFPYSPKCLRIAKISFIIHQNNK